MVTTEIKSTTKVQELFGVADNAAIIALAADQDKLMDAIEDLPELQALIEDFLAANGNAIEGTDVIEIATKYLAEVQAKLVVESKDDGKKKVEAVAGIGDLKFADSENLPETTETDFLITKIRTWGKKVQARATKEWYKTCTIDGIYLVKDGEGGIEMISGQVVSNTRLFSKIVPEIANLDVDMEVDIPREKNLAFKVRTEATIKDTTTYYDSRPQVIAAAKKLGKKISQNRVSNEAQVLCYHTASNKVVFRGLGARILKDMVESKIQQAIALEEAKAKALLDLQKRKVESMLEQDAKRIENQLAIEREAAASVNVTTKMTSLIDALTENVDKITALKLDPQALMLKALEQK